MGFFSFLFGTSISSESLPFENNIKFNRIKSEHKLIIGEELNIWSKPNTSIVNLYANGSIGGSGIIGTTNNKFLNNHIGNTENLFIENEIIDFDNNYINLKIRMFVDENLSENNRKEYQDEWLKKIMSKYNPKTNWSVRFYSENKLEKSKIRLKTVEKENLYNYDNYSKELIWLENLEGEKLGAENTAHTEDINKTLRAVYSGHEIEIKFITKDSNYYTLEIGKKNNS